MRSSLQLKQCARPRTGVPCMRGDLLAASCCRDRNCACKRIVMETDQATKKFLHDMGLMALGLRQEKTQTGDEERLCGTFAETKCVWRQLRGRCASTRRSRSSRFTRRFLFPHCRPAPPGQRAVAPLKSPFHAAFRDAGDCLRGQISLTSQ